MELLAEHFESIRFVTSTGLIDFAMLESDPPDLVISLFLEEQPAVLAAPDESIRIDDESAMADLPVRVPPVGEHW